METIDAVNREGRERLHPSLINPSWLVLRRRREIFKGWIARMGAMRDLEVLDVGGRIQPYRSLLQKQISHYVAIDLRKSPLVNIVASGEQIPFCDDSFDLAICTQVLQYVPDPRAVVEEIHRVLKPGGWFLLSAPALALRDADEERWRFLPETVRRLLRDFGEVQIVPEGGSVIGLFRSINSCLNMFARYPAVRSLFRYTVFPFINLTGEFLDSISGSRNDQFAANYSACARKRPIPR